MKNLSCPLEVNRRREDRRADDEVSYTIRLSSGWQGTGVTGPRILAECLQSDQRRGLGARKKTRRPDRLSEENPGESIEIYRILDDEVSEMFSRILANEQARRP